jgi:hypothetical protein
VASALFLTQRTLSLFIMRPSIIATTLGGTIIADITITGTPRITV